MRMAKLRGLRERAGLSQIELAVKADVSLGVVQKLEQPTRVRRESAEKIARALGVPVEEIDELRGAISDEGGDGDS
jgi:transcriptional regulator with XRE-family HTH domain